MRPEVIVSFNAQQRHALPLPTGEPAMAADLARRWLDEQFVANECEPLRASGKVLIADKVLVLASTVGDARFTTDPAWALDFAQATVAALGRPVVRVDVESGAISY